MFLCIMIIVLFNKDELTEYYKLLTLMGNDINTIEDNPFHKSDRNNLVSQNSPFQTALPILSEQEEEHMVQIIASRKQLLDSQYICTIQNYRFKEQKSNSCQFHKQLVLIYSKFDYRLCQMPIRDYHSKFLTTDIYQMIFCVASALLVYRRHNMHHGDIYVDTICKKKDNLWQIIDNIYIKNGINAYESVLEGQQAFITPLQIQRIRHGFIRQSPLIQQSDDIFGLGMVSLQMASQKPSKECYSHSFLRLSQQKIQEHLSVAANLHGRSLATLISKMVQFQQDYRTSLQEIIRHPEVGGSRKHSLKNQNYNNRRSNTNFIQNDKKAFSYKSKSIEKHSIYYPSSKEITEMNNYSRSNSVPRLMTSSYLDKKSRISKNQGTQKISLSKNTSRIKDNEKSNSHNTSHSALSMNNQFRLRQIHHNHTQGPPLPKKTGSHKNQPGNSNTKQMFRTPLALAQSIKQQNKKQKVVIPYKPLTMDNTGINISRSMKNIYNQGQTYYI